MVKTDTDVCLAVSCPFVCKQSGVHEDIALQKGICLQALVKRKPKEVVCIATVRIRKAKANGR